MRVGRQAQVGAGPRYGRLFTPGKDVRGGYPTFPAWAGKNAYRRAVDSGLLYAEGYACRRPASRPTRQGALRARPPWIRGSANRVPRTSRVALRSGFVRRFHDARHSDDGSDMFSYVSIGLTKR